MKLKADYKLTSHRGVVAQNQDKGLSQEVVQKLVEVIPDKLL